MKTLVVVLLATPGLFGLPSAAVGSPPSDHAVESGVSSELDAGEVSLHDDMVHDDMVHGGETGHHATALAGRVVRPWLGKRITVRNTVPGDGGKVVRRSIQDWNNAGLGVRFVLVKGKKAQVTVKAQLRSPCGAGPIGCAHLGRTRGATVWLIGRRKTFKKLRDPVLWMNVTSHELGHILGLGHTLNRKALMYPIVGGSIVSTPDGTCRHYTRTELRPLHRAYDKRLSIKKALVPRTSCRFSPLPGPVTGLRAVRRGQSVSVTWDAAKNAAGHQLMRGPASGACPASPSDSRARLISSGKHTRAEDHPAREGPTYCYRVFALSAQGHYRARSSPSVRFRAVTPRPAQPAVTVEALPSTEWSAYPLRVTGWSGEVVYSMGLEGSFENEGWGRLQAGEALDVYARPDDGRVRLRFWQVATTFSHEELRSVPQEVVITLPAVQRPEVSLTLITSPTTPYEWRVTGLTGDLSYSVGESGFSDDVWGSVWEYDPYVWWWERPDGGKLYLRFWRSEYTVGGNEVRSASQDVVVDVPVRTG